MNVQVKKIVPTVKNSEILSGISMLSNSGYQIASALGASVPPEVAVAIYIISIISSTGSEIAKRFEEGEKDIQKDIEKM